MKSIIGLNTKMDDHVWNLPSQLTLFYEDTNKDKSHSSSVLFVSL